MSEEEGDGASETTVNKYYQVPSDSQSRVQPREPAVIADSPGFGSKARSVSLVTFALKSSREQGIKRPEQRKEEAETWDGKAN